MAYSPDPIDFRPGRRGLWPWLVLVTVAGCSPFGGGRPAAAPVPAPERVDEANILDDEIRPVPEALLGAATYDLPVEANNWVQGELDFLLSQRREVVSNWIERGDFYADFVRQVFRDEGLPTDLYHLGMIESGYVAEARSSVGAVGMWQFMPATARDLGLRIDSTVDERLDPVRSTRAAARYLKTLYRIHGDWALVAAAYNAGTGRISRALDATSATNFWELARRGDLANETEHYVPRLYAMTIIDHNRARYGFIEDAQRRTFAFDSIQVEYSISLAELAQISGVDDQVLERLNPHLIRGITPAGGYWVWVPAGEGEEIQRSYLASDFRRNQGAGSYTVRWGDTLSQIAAAADLPIDRIREMNPDVALDPLRAGTVLRLPYAVAEELAARTDDVPIEEPPAAPVVRSASPGGRSESGTPDDPAEVAEPTGDEDAIVHRVAAGETLYSISRRYNVTIARIQELNAIDGSIIRVGQELLIQPALEVAASADQPDEVVHVVEPGETLWAIAQEFGSSVDAIQEANDLGGTTIRPGQRLIVP